MIEGRVQGFLIVPADQAGPTSLANARALGKRGSASERGYYRVSPHELGVHLSLAAHTGFER